MICTSDSSGSRCRENGQGRSRKPGGTTVVNGHHQPHQQCKNMYYCLLAVSRALTVLSEPHNAAGPARKMVSETLGHLAKLAPLVSSKAEMRTQPALTPTRSPRPQQGCSPVTLKRGGGREDWNPVKNKGTHYLKQAYSASSVNPGFPSPPHPRPAACLFPSASLKGLAGRPPSPARGVPLQFPSGTPF